MVDYTVEETGIMYVQDVPVSSTANQVQCDDIHKNRE